MSKIPLGATIAQAYRFAFRDFPKIAGIIWLPWLVLSVAGFLLRPQTAMLSQDITTRNFAGLGGVLLTLTPFYLLALYLMFMQIAGVTQQALGLRAGSPYYYLSFGKTIWRLVGAGLLAVLIVLGLYLALILGGVALGALLALVGRLLDLGRGAGGLMVILVTIIAFCAYIYILVRLTFFLNPVVIAESRISFRRNWSLGKSNFWRMFLILVAVLAPVTLIAFLVFRFWYGLPPSTPMNASPDQIAAGRAAIAAWMAASMNRSIDYWYIVYPANGVIVVLMYGLGCGAQCFAYRALVPETPVSASPP